MFSKFNVCLATDSYKLSHHKMMPEGTQYVESYFEFRLGSKFESAIFFGLQALLKKLEGQVVTKECIDEAEVLVNRHVGPNVFNRERWEYILKTYKGCLPVQIRAVPEGTKLEINNVLMIVKNTDPNCYWLTNHLETYLTHVWYPSTVASLGAHVKDIFKCKLEKSCDVGVNFPGLNFMLHDFGMRGVSSMESAEIGGGAHLVNFDGTDTVVAMPFIKEYYSGDYGYSIPASEHSVMTALGREGEAAVVGRILDAYPTGLVAIVGDSYDIYNFTYNIIGGVHKERVLARDGKVVVRPDSGDPIKSIPVLARIIDEKFGCTINSKGFKVFNPKIGLIWGDGIDSVGIDATLDSLMDAGYSAENMVFGMGGGLLQKVNRDTQRSAFKSCAQCRDGIWYDIFKDPIDKGKVSKKGRLKLIKDGDGYKTVLASAPGEDVLQVVFENGFITKSYTFEEVRQNAK